MHIIDKDRDHILYFHTGHECIQYLDTNEQFYLDTGEIVTQYRPCKKCNKKRTIEGHDPCIPNLPGVRFACCGHGTKNGYILFDNNIGIYGDFDHVRHFVRDEDNRLRTEKLIQIRNGWL